LIGLPDLRDPVLVAQHQRHLVQVEAEQRLQLHDPFHPGNVALRVAPQAAGRGTGRDDQAYLLVVAQRPFGYAEALGRRANPEQPPAPAAGRMLRARRATGHMLRAG